MWLLPEWPDYDGGGLLAANPDAAEADIDTAMAGNICRCGCYPRIKGAIQSVASNTLGYDAMAEEVAS